MANVPLSKSPVADLLLSAHQDLNQIKIEITVNVLPPENMSTVPEPNASPQLDITKTEELLPPVLSPVDIQKFLGIGKKQSYELLNSNLFHVSRVGRRIFVSRTVFIEWLEGTSEVKRRS